MTCLVDEVRTVDAAYLNFSEALGTVSYNILTDKLMKYSLGNWIVVWTVNCPNCQSQRILKDMKSNWRPVTDGVLQGPVLFNIFIYDLHDRKVHSKFPDDTKLEQVADTPDGYAAILRDHIRLEKLANNHLIQFKRRKCKILHLGRNNPRHQQAGG
ncbi:mitochondrial enolase superfamily member 1 [Grus japonensis]|uniref:Mitochondrial enolase superfamily member 1 n=1 Tax=Grus japonensis TaxID=30415 RepID=A0ABC9X4R1_GRUJA